MLVTIAAKTSVVRLATGILVWPMREPVLLANQVATLDQISGGRVTLAVAAGGYRDEFEAVAPDLADASRTRLMAVGIEALRILFGQRRSTYAGRYRRFCDVESYLSRCSRRCRSFPAAMPRAPFAGRGSNSGLAAGQAWRGRNCLWPRRSREIRPSHGP
ncbi:LLM class flavin-dependent oxidoreductase [Mycobacterium gastri]